MIFNGEKENRSVDEVFDYIIVGSGAAGATAARILADTGSSIAVVEEGPLVTTEEFKDRLFPASNRILRGGGLGALMARGRTFIPIVQGSCLGGSTVVNSAIVWRIPDDVWEPWKTEYGLGEALPLAELHRNWDQIERELAVQPTPAEVWGENNRLMDAARQKLGVRGEAMRRNVRDCRGSARCQMGCPFGAKQSMLVTYLPYAERRGAALFTCARVDQVVFDGNRAVGVRGNFHRPAVEKNIAPFSLHARRSVIVAASASQTPGLLQRSGVRSRHLGAHFQAHPGASVVGVFDRPVNMWFGATQGYEVDEHRVDGRFKVETLSLAPELVMSQLPGVGRKWVEHMAGAAHLASWAVALRAEAQGSVRENLLGTDIRYDLTRSDLAHLKQGLRFAAELLFAAGAREVIPGVFGLPDRLSEPAQARLLEEGPDDPAAYRLIATHLFGTARMSANPQYGVVGTDFQVHERENLYVIDSSIFPTNLGVNPQHAIMGIAMHAVRRIAGRKE